LALTGVDECRPLAALAGDVRAAAGAANGWRVLRGYDEAAERALDGDADPSGRKERDGVLATAISEARLLKDDDELAELTAVIKTTYRGFSDVIRAMRTAKSERELETAFWSRARQEGNGVGYGTIAAAGHHACTLHWKKNDGALRPQDLLLLDAGVEGDQLYTADITRTLPIGGAFSKEQRAVYELVHRAQAAAIKAVRPGNDFMEPNRVAMEVLAHGLEDLGILGVPAAEALKPENQFYKRYTLHNVSHMLGLDVHDCAKARAEAYKYGKLQPGMVLTVEPGLYFQTDDLTVPARYRGIGVRIEDDVVVTGKGCRNLSGFIPSAADDVEEWVKAVWKKGKGKDKGKGRDKKEKKPKKKKS
jgi:Xaa-Pro aminopeptidase